MRIKICAVTLLLCAVTASAQDDPTIMTINGKSIARSEFEYSYNKNNTETVVDKKSIEEYVDLFINYKLKVEAAIDAGIDTTAAFKKEFATYRNQQTRPMLVTDDDIENIALSIYNETRERVDTSGGLIKPAHIYVAVKQKAPQEEWDAAKAKADSIYALILGGASFSDLAIELSDDRQSGLDGGELTWAEHGRYIKPFEDAAYALQPGEVSEPVQSPAGYHIIKMLDRSMFFSYDSVRTSIMAYVDQRGFRQKLMKQRIDSIAAAANVTTDEADELYAAELMAADSDLKYLIGEYYDGLLLFEISNKQVWDKAAKDTVGLQAYYAKHKKQYKWAAPRYKGIAYYTKEEQDIDAVKQTVSAIPFEQWGDVLRKEFNDSTIRIQVVKSIFKEGDNDLIDHDVYGKDVTVPAKADYPFTAVYGTLLKAPESYLDVRELVVADYQDTLEAAWVEELRAKYPVEVDKAVVATVNKH